MAKPKTHSRSAATKAIHSNHTSRTSSPPSRSERRPRLQLEWTHTLLPEQWAPYCAAIHALREIEVPFMLGGGFAMASYTGRWRNTKDIDFYIRHEDREKVVEALSKAGFTDYFDQLAYDRNWIYRSTRDGVIVDNIWAMANQRAQVDDHWFEHAPEIAIHGEGLKVVPLEEFVWCKLYILQRDHCDWTDVMNVLFAAGTRMNWDRLLWRLEDDWPLLKALLTVYGWVCPRRARLLPDGLRRKLKLAAPEIPRRNKRDRIRLLDSRAWFAASLDPNQPLAV